MKSQEMFFLKFCWVATLLLKHRALGIFVLVSCHLILPLVSSVSSCLLLTLPPLSSLWIIVCR